jgi:hypothetical protein
MEVAEVADECPGDQYTSLFIKYIALLHQLMHLMVSYDCDEVLCLYLLYEFILSNEISLA